MNPIRLLAALVVALVLLVIGPRVRAEGRPNVILIMADDFGYECVRANGGTSYATPHLDQLAADGVRFERCYAQPLCTPTRVQLMTGRYNVRNYTVFGKMDPSLKTFGNLFKDAGYATGMVGKWQLGRIADLPGKFGFDEAFLWQHLRRPPRYGNPGLEINGVVKDFKNGEYGPELLNNYAREFISRNKTRPFFLYYPMVLPHGPHMATPDSKDWDPKLQGEKRSGNPRHFGDMVAYTDKMVGRLVEHLEKEGVRENTLIVFLGDNGCGAGVRSRMGRREIQGGKGKPTETGMRVPLIVNWPKQIATPRVVKDLVDTTDFLPTICEAAGVAVPADWKPDGRTFLPQLRGEPGAPREWVYSWYAPRGEFMHEFAADKRWKLFSTGRLVEIDPEALAEREITVPTEESKAAQARLRAVLDQFKDARPAHLAKPRANRQGAEGKADE